MMHRIAPRTELPDHDIEIHYLNRLVSDLKLWINDITPYRIIDLERVYEWRHIHAPSLIRCHGFNFRQKDELGRPKFSVQRGHDSALEYFNALLSDVAKKLKDEQPDVSITNERLDEAFEHIQNISSCRHPTIYY